MPYQNLITEFSSNPVTFGTVRVNDELTMTCVMAKNCYVR